MYHVHVHVLVHYLPIHSWYTCIPAICHGLFRYMNQRWKWTWLSIWRIINSSMLISGYSVSVRCSCFFHFSFDYSFDEGVNNDVVYRLAQFLSLNVPLFTSLLCSSSPPPPLVFSPSPDSLHNLLSKPSSSKEWQLALHTDKLEAERHMYGSTHMHKPHTCTCMILTKIIESHVCV